MPAFHLIDAWRFRSAKISKNRIKMPLAMVSIASCFCFMRTADAFLRAESYCQFWVLCSTVWDKWRGRLPPFPCIAPWSPGLHMWTPLQTRAGVRSGHRALVSRWPKMVRIRRTVTQLPISCCFPRCNNRQESEEAEFPLLDAGKEISPFFLFVRTFILETCNGNRDIFSVSLWERRNLPKAQAQLHVVKQPSS